MNSHLMIKLCEIIVGAVFIQATPQCRAVIGYGLFRIT